MKEIFVLDRIESVLWPTATANRVTSVLLAHAAYTTYEYTYVYIRMYCTVLGYTLYIVQYLYIISEKH